jgi:hypothetical protein
MRKIQSALAVLTGLGIIHVHAAESTNAPYPIPKAFAAMTNADVLPSFAPVAVYECFSNKATRVVCMGAAFVPYDDQCRVILPAGIFSDTQFKGAFGVRILRPDSGSLIGFINKVAIAGTNAENASMAIGTVGTNEVHLSRSSVMTNWPVLPFFEPAVSVRGLAVKKVTSLLTGREVRIIGHGYPLVNIEGLVVSDNIRQKYGDALGDSIGTVDPDQTYLVIEVDPNGLDGSVFFDNHGRIYTYYNGFRPSGETKIGKRLIMDFKDHYGEAPRSVAALAGPYVPSTVRHKVTAPGSLKATSRPD